MTVMDKEKRVNDVLRVVRKNKKISVVVDEIMVLAKMLGVDVVGRTHGELIYDGESKAQVTYELRFHVERDGRTFEEKIVFAYRDNKLYSVETFIYPFTLQKTLDIKKSHEFLESFKKIFH
jgi:hypothetical protein